MNWLKKITNVYFDFTRSERNGIIVLISLILILTIIRFIIPHFSKSNNVDIISFNAKVERLNQLNDSIRIAKEKSKKSSYYKNNNYSYRNTFRNDSVKKESSSYGKVINSSNQNEIRDIELREFNPNTEDREGLLTLGFKEFQINAMLKYREKGGKYKQANDLMKIYGVDSSFFEMILPFIKIESDKAKERVIVELNGADTVALMKIHGIGSSYAKRIIKYRDELGGFVSKTQLLEVYKFPNELYTSIEDVIEVDSMRINKIDLNFVDFKTLNKHPYCSFESTKRILNYRSKNGSFSSSIQLIKDSVLNDEEYDKLRHYLTP